jgi:hypothetical protein
VPSFRRVRPPAAVPLLAAALGGCLLGGCSRGESRAAPAAAAGDAGRATDRSLARGDRVTTADGVTAPDVRPTRPAYRVAPAADAGRVTGVVLLDGRAPADTTITPADADRRACRATHTVPAVDVDGTAAGPAVRGAVVWLEGVAAGKAMPTTRRFELAVDGCALVPRHLPVAVGGTLNVHGIDALETRLRFARLGATADAGRVLLRTTMTAAGQVVPDEHVLAEPGAVEVREETRPWMRAWVLAFDQPYFAATGAGGAFTLADVPPGVYRLVAWHERLGRVVAPVTVAPGQAAAVTLRLRAPDTTLAGTTAAAASLVGR